MLTNHDRCDSTACSAQAFYRVEGFAGVLDFCGHHYTANASALEAQGFVVTVDNYNKINAKSESSA